MEWSLEDLEKEREKEVARPKNFPEQSLEEGGFLWSKQPRMYHV